MLPKFLLFTAFCSLLLIYTTHGAPTDKRLSPGEDLKSAGPLLLQEDCNSMTCTRHCSALVGHPCNCLCFSGACRCFCKQ
ncbi:hypothetical protein QR680_015278 [Steinernema hermaphroditum]|uniref:Invertebrate defensins family profile domain-containing protein n=1 Tax=Steinernema hermaphroditum TaxID=289476 RepID=A0AA39H759_9BILA|nr:hypothetical protein QR680_015278 [Steinernema hermaphroditum]